MHAELQTILTGKEPTFREYDALLQSASAQYDASTTNIRRPSRAVYMSDMDCVPEQTDSDSEYPFDESTQPYDIVSSIDIICTNIAYSRRPPPRDRPSYPDA